MRLLVIVLIFASLTACRTAAPQSTGPHRAMLGFEDEPLSDDWKDWTPEPTTSTPAALVEEATAFDYWQVTDDKTLEEVWSAIFGLLAEVRRTAPADYEPTFRMLMTVLEPNAEDGVARLDATFFAAKRGSSPMWEGVGWRVWRQMPSGAAPAVSVWLRRMEAGSEKPIEAFIWFYSAVNETKSLTLRFDGRESWKMTLADGVATAVETPVAGETELLRGILLATFWNPVVGRAYLESPIERLETPSQTPAQHPPALGLTLADRDIEQVFTDSVFAPRLTLFPAKHPE